MDKYQRKFLVNETIPNYINEAKLSILLFNIKKQLANSYSFIDIKELTNSLTMRLIAWKFYQFSDETKDYLKKKVFNKINNGYL